MRRIDVNLSSLKETKPHQYLLRFLFGGSCTLLAGLIAKRYGPGIGGLFLAFPAIFPAGASLIEDHEKKRKTEVGSDGRKRGRMAASLDSAGASLGCVGLLMFAAILSRELPSHNAYCIISVAVLGWGIVSYMLWLIRNNMRR
jgi:xanthine/uracil/vitamin C permease (AzgA family)